MTVKKCRVCNSNFFKKPLLEYKNMPRAAQFLPDKAELDSDKGIDLEVCQCSGCGLVQLSNEPVHYYKDVIRASAFSEEMEAFRIKQFGDFVEKYSLKNKKIVEIGCGCGEYLSIIQKFELDAYGLEHSEKSTKQCLDNGLKVSRDFIENADCKLKNAPFDAFYILNFLEHIPDLNSVLRGIYNNLSDDAVGMIEVPNFDIVLRNKRFSDFIIDHLYYFTEKTLISTLNYNGFEVETCDVIWHDHLISAVVKKRKPLDLSGFDQYQDKMKDELKQYIKRFGHKKVAVWGASHQALAIILMADIADDICYVIDSAPFKQGKYTPASHLAIVSPEILKSEAADAIIVMAAGYSDEVVNIIKEKFNKSIQIAVLRDYGLESVC